MSSTPVWRDGNYVTPSTPTDRYYYPPPPGSNQANQQGSAAWTPAPPGLEDTPLPSTYPPPPSADHHDVDYRFNAAGKVYDSGPLTTDTTTTTVSSTSRFTDKPPDERTSSGNNWVGSGYDSRQPPTESSHGGQSSPHDDRHGDGPREGSGGSRQQSTESRDRSDQGRSRDRPSRRSRDRSRDRSRRSRDRSQGRSTRRSRDRSTGRSRDRSRGRSRERSRSRSRDRTWRRTRDDSRDRSRDQSRERSRDRSRGRSRERSRGRSHRDDYDSDREDRSSHYDRQSDYRRAVPSQTILLKNLPFTIEENDLMVELKRSGAIVRDLRLIKKNRADVIGGPRGIAFVDLSSLEDATDWMKLNQGRLFMHGNTVTLHYSNTPMDQEWSCFKCGVRNFKKRTHCFKCGVTKDESDQAREGDGYQEISNTPTNVLLIRGLDTLTTSDVIDRSLRIIAPNSQFTVRLARDDLTNISRGFCYIELSTVNDSRDLLHTICSAVPPCTIDGRRILLSYSRQGLLGNQPSNIATQAIQAASWSSEPKPSQISSAAVTHSKPFTHSSSYPPPTGHVTGSSDQRGLAGVAHPQGVTQPPPSQSANTAFFVYPTPDVSKYVYDPVSGFYFDNTTGLYYDSKTQYYWNTVTRQYMYWDGSKSTYLPVSPDTTQQTQSATATPTTTPISSDQSAVSTQSADVKTTTVTAKLTDGKEKEKKERNNQAKKIAKDMERWAKSQQKMKEQLAMSQQGSGRFGGDHSSQKGAADAGFTILEMKTTEKDRMEAVKDVLRKAPVPTAVSTGILSLSNYGSDNEEESTALTGGGGGVGGGQTGADSTRDDFLDLTRVACLLCKRQFKDVQTLKKHSQKSDLHKQNLEAHHRQMASFMEQEQEAEAEGEMKYRDRAKERRQKYGVLDPPQSKKSKRKQSQQSTEHYDQPTVSGLGTDNIGNKMLGKMGWKQGEGLGKSKQGIVKPIEADSHEQGAGLGVTSHKSRITPTGDYRKDVRLMTYFRYQEIDQ